VILSDIQILSAINAGDIVINPFDRRYLGTNSYDVHLGRHLAVYKNTILDPKHPNDVDYVEIPDTGLVIYPGEFFLGVTAEYTETRRYVPFIEGKSSIGRLGLFIHVTAGRGDAGFQNHWTLELAAAHAVRVYAGMPIGQLIYFDTGPVAVPYDKKRSAKYNAHYTGQEPRPTPSMMWKNFRKDDDNG